MGEAGRRLQREGKCGIFNKDRDNRTLVSEHPEQSARGSLLPLALLPENVLFFKLGEASARASAWSPPSAGGVGQAAGGPRGLVLLVILFLGSILLLGAAPVI